MNKLY